MIVCYLLCTTNASFILAYGGINTINNQGKNSQKEKIHLNSIIYIGIDLKVRAGC